MLADGASGPRFHPTMLRMLFWKAGLLSYLLGPPPLPLQPVSVIVEPLIVSDVPPAATTLGETLG